ncbi:hypothetical protein FIE12Z_2212 [Fusarium flagelliforme]|uniref:Uncharacterized protein n=1 Tax=Fusarium flagelliforme TaxID=2675880 RepID=A0A395N0A3_9HYPO|nr:hypothetical protein FIE12Z_2212 [Fusarium flagelliforme]
MSFNNQLARLFDQMEQNGVDPDTIDNFSEQIRSTQSQGQAIRGLLETMIGEMKRDFSNRSKSPAMAEEWAGRFSAMFAVAEEITKKK